MNAEKRRESQPSCTVAAFLRLSHGVTYLFSGLASLCGSIIIVRKEDRVKEASGGPTVDRKEHQE